MGKKPLDLVADHFQIPIFEAREKLNDVQARLTPAPPYKLIAEIIINNPGLSDLDELASIITVTDPKFQFIYQKENPDKLVNEQDLLYKLVVNYLHPKLPYSTYKKIDKEEIINKSPSGIAAYITKNLLGFILKENINLYKRVQSRTYPKTRTTDFSLIREEYPQVISVDSITNLLIANFNYIRIEDRNLYLEVKEKLFPNLPIQVFSDVMRNALEKNPQTIIDSIVSQYDEFILDKDYQKIKNLIYPEPDPKFLKKLMTNNPGLSDPGKIAKKITSDYDDYIPVSDFPLYTRVNDAFQGHVPVKIFSASRSNNPDPYLLEDIVNNIDIKHPNLQLKLYKEAQLMISPEPSVENLRDIRLSYGLDLSKSKLVRKFLDNSSDHIHVNDLKLYQKVKKKIHPYLKVSEFNQFREVLSGSSSVDQIVDEISNNSLNYMSMESVKKLNQFLFPAISKSEALDFKRNAWVGISSWELAGFISDKSSSHISGSRLTLFKETDKLLYPDLTLSDFRTALKIEGDLANSESLSVRLEKMEHKYILLSKCNQIRKLVYPEITDREILNYYHSEKTLLSSKEIASLITSKSGKYDMISKKEKKKGIKISKNWDWNY